MQVQLSWEERFINWLVNSKTLRQRMGKATRGLDCIELDRLVFEDVRPFFDGLRADVTRDKGDLRAIISDGIAAAEQANASMGTTTPQLESWLKRAKEALS